MYYNKWVRLDVAPPAVFFLIIYSPFTASLDKKGTMYVSVEIMKPRNRQFDYGWDWKNNILMR